MESGSLIMMAIIAEYAEECLSSGRIIMGYETEMPRNLGQYAKPEIERTITEALSLLMTGFEVTVKVRRGRIVVTAIP